MPAAWRRSGAQAQDSTSTCLSLTLTCSHITITPTASGTGLYQHLFIPDANPNPNVSQVMGEVLQCHLAVLAIVDTPLPQVGNSLSPHHASLSLSPAMCLASPAMRLASPAMRLASRVTCMAPQPLALTTTVHQEVDWGEDEYKVHPAALKLTTSLPQPRHVPHDRNSQRLQASSILFTLLVSSLSEQVSASEG